MAKTSKLEKLTCCLEPTSYLFVLIDSVNPQKNVSTSHDSNSPVRVGRDNRARHRPAALGPALPALLAPPPNRRQLLPPVAHGPRQCVDQGQDAVPRGRGLLRREPRRRDASGSEQRLTFGMAAQFYRPWLGSRRVARRPRGP